MPSVQGSIRMTWPEGSRNWKVPCPSQVICILDDSSASAALYHKCRVRPLTQKDDLLIERFLSVARRICQGCAPRFGQVEGEDYFFDLGVPGKRRLCPFSGKLIDESWEDRASLRMLENAIKKALEESKTAAP